jgi:hypothetical protein
MLTLEVLLSLIDGQPSDAFDAPLAAEAGRIAGGLPPTATTRVVHSLQHHREAARQAGDPLGRLDELLASGLPPAHTRVPVTSFDAVLEVSVPDGTDPARLLDGLDGLVDRLGGAADPARSAAVLGVDHTIIEGSGALQLFYCLRRVPALTHEQFSAYWLNQLVEHTTKTPGKSAYRQLHADPDLTLRASKAAGVAIDDVDGVALEWYPDMASFWSAVGWANEPDAGVIQAETQMSDFSRALSILGYGPDGLG